MEQERIPVPGEFYRHFKDKLYQVKAIAYHSETKEKMVVYQAMYGSFQMYVRPYEMFVSEVDHEKYPDAPQKYRFERVELPAGQTPLQATEKRIEESREKRIEKPEESVLEAEEIELQEIEDKIDDRLFRFLEADTYEDKLHVLTGLCGELDDSLISAMGLAIDAEVPQGPLERRYTSLKNCIIAHIKYEGRKTR